jgi:hypothetical protein
VNFRIYTEFCGAKGWPGRLAPPGLATSASGRVAATIQGGPHARRVWSGDMAGAGPACIERQNRSVEPELSRVRISVDVARTQQSWEVLARALQLRSISS